MKKCNNCQKEIDSKATVCPYCQADQRNWFMKHIMATLVFVLILLLAIVYSSNIKMIFSQLGKKNATIPASAKSDAVSMAKFNKIAKGMSYKDVKAVLGFEGEVISSGSDKMGNKTMIYSWKGADKTSNINVLFENDKMFSKSQSKLK